MPNEKKTTVALNEVVDRDLSVFFDHQLDAAANRMVAFTVRDPEDREAFSAHWSKIRADDSVAMRTIVFNGHVAGYVGSFERAGKREICYWIGKPYWGKGVATVAVALFLKEDQSRPLHAGVAKDNLASIRVLEKCGFEVVGCERGFAKARGEDIEEVVLKLE